MDDYKDCKYSAYLPKYLENCDVIEDKSEAACSGKLDVMFHDILNNIYYYIRYYYGSCEVCDGWYYLEDEAITKEIDDLILKMTEKEYKSWKDRKEKNYVS